EDGIRDLIVTGVQTCALPIFRARAWSPCARLYPKASALRASLRGRRSALASRDGARFLATEVGADGRADFLLFGGGGARTELPQIGRASCRESGEAAVRAGCV